MRLIAKHSRVERPTIYAFRLALLLDALAKSFDAPPVMLGTVVVTVSIFVAVEKIPISLVLSLVPSAHFKQLQLGVLDSTIDGLLIS